MNKLNYAELGSKRILLRLYLVGLIVLLLLSGARAVNKVADPAAGGMDLHTIWYPGHSLRQEQNPYEAYLQHQEPQLPVTYLDGTVTENSPVAQPGLAATPTNTAPIYLLLAPITFFSWPWAKWGWFCLNLIFLLLIPLLVIANFPYSDRLSPTVKLLICLTTFCFTSSRVAIWLGQTTLLILTLLFASFKTRDKKPWLAGLLLGVAASKYSLALPLVLFYVWEGKRRNGVILATAALVQIGGILLMSLISDTPPWLFIDYYWSIFRLVAGSPEDGIQLAILAPPGSIWRVLLPILLTVFVLYTLQLRYIGNNPIKSYLALGVFSLWTLLIAYHGVHDLVIVAWLLPVAFLVIIEPGWWRLTRRQANWITVALVAVFSLFLFPGVILDIFLEPVRSELWFEYLNVIALSVLLITFLWLYGATPSESDGNISGATAHIC